MVDESYVGGNPKNFSNKKKREYTKSGRGTDKQPIVALVERGGRVRSWPIANITAKTLQGAIRDNVAPSAGIQTDQHLDAGGIQRNVARAILDDEVFKMGQTLGHRIDAVLRYGFGFGHEGISQRVSNQLDVDFLLCPRKAQQGHALAQPLQ